ncbi:hypothetical protein Tco_1366720, partial [Tanacetum coccineum]
MDSNLPVFNSYRVSRFACKDNRYWLERFNL